MCHLREFFIVHHMREKEDKRAEVVTIPRIHSQQIILDLSGQGHAYDELVRHSCQAGATTLGIKTLGAYAECCNLSRLFLISVRVTAWQRPYIFLKCNSV
jgi:hypothetical protein